MKKQLLTIAVALLAFVSFGQEVTWSDTAWYATSSHTPNSIWFGDLNGDEYKDMISTNRDDAVMMVFLNNGDGTFGEVSVINTYQAPNTTIIADFNNDSKNDLAIVHSSGTNSDNKVTVFLGNGDGTFQNYSRYTAYGSYTKTMKPKDVNGDGFQDLLVTSAGWDGFSVLVNDGDGTFTLGNHYATATEASSLEIGDFNNDGMWDVAIACGYYSSGNQIDMFFGNGDATFGNKTSYTTPVAGKKAYPTSVGDIENDGDVDILVVVSTDNQTTYLMKNDGTGTFTFELLADGYSNSKFIDWDGDGSIDVLAQKYDAITAIFSDLTFFKNNGSGVLSPTIIKSETEGLFISDLNNDDLSDLAFRDQDNKRLGVYLQESVHTLTAQSLPNASVLRTVEIAISTNKLLADDNVIAYQFNASYDTTKLAYLGATTEGCITETGSTDINSQTNGQLAISYMTSEALTGAGDLIKLQFKVIASGSSDITLTDAFLNTTEVTELTAGTVTAFYNYGDVDANDHVQAYDAAITLQMSVGLNPLPELDPTPWENWRSVVADVDNTMTPNTAIDITAYDASLILQYSTGNISYFPAHPEPPEEVIEDITGGGTVFEKKAGINVQVEKGKIIFYPTGELMGLNISIAEQELLNNPIYGNISYFAENINAEKKDYKIGVCSTKAFAENEAVVSIPYRSETEQSITLEITVNSVKQTITVLLSSTTGLNKLNKNSVRIFPNPVQDRLQFSGLSQASRVTLYNLRGEPIKQATVQYELGISELPKGIYILKIETENGTISKQIIKQ